MKRFQKKRLKYFTLVYTINVSGTFFCSTYWYRYFLPSQVLIEKKRKLGKIMFCFLNVIGILDPDST